MTERELIKKLNNLRDFQPDSGWKKHCREVLFSQISAGSAVKSPSSNLQVVWENIIGREIFVQLAKPVWFTSAACVLILAIGIGGVYASKNSKPGDSLYIAKIISEQTQLAITFGEKEKAKLSVEFAANRAKEITQVLKAEGESGANKEKLETLTKNFKKEISQAKGRLSTIKSQSQQAKDDEQVFGANLGKNDQRMEIAEPVKPEAAKPESSKTGAEKPEAVASASRPELETKATPVQTAEADKMLDEAEKMFDEKNYDGTINKLEEVNKAINKSGEVKGESETATSTE